MALAPAEKGARIVVAEVGIHGVIVRATRMTDGKHDPSCIAADRKAEVGIVKSEARPFGEARSGSSRYFTARLIASARSVFSQEKPPSLSGARPKWP